MTPRIERVAIGHAFPETAKGRAVGKEVETDDPVAQCHDRPAGLHFLKADFDLFLCGCSCRGTLSGTLAGPLAGIGVLSGHRLVNIIQCGGCRLGTMALDVLVDFIPDRRLVGSGAPRFLMHEFPRRPGAPVPRTTVVMSSQALGLGLLARSLFGCGRPARHIRAVFGCEAVGAIGQVGRVAQFGFARGGMHHMGLAIAQRGTHGATAMRERLSLMLPAPGLHAADVDGGLFAGGGQDRGVHHAVLFAPAELDAVEQQSMLVGLVIEDQVRDDAVLIDFADLGLLFREQVIGEGVGLFLRCVRRPVFAIASPGLAVEVVRFGWRAVQGEDLQSFQCEGFTQRAVAEHLGPMGRVHGGRLRIFGRVRGCLLCLSCRFVDGHWRFLLPV